MEIKLNLYYDDLLDVYKDTHLQMIKTHCFKPEVVKWIKLVGGATYYNRFGMCHRFPYKEPEKCVDRVSDVE
jgi:hypothetical protein